MQKILYAIQMKEAEREIENRIRNHDIISAGAVAYREAILPSLKEHPADILLYRESLKGSIDTFALMKQIRIEFPQLRIVFIATQQPVTSRLLCELVFLGIYDIINSNSPSINDIADFIINPRDFNFAEKYFHEENMDSLIPNHPGTAGEETHNGKRKGFFGGIIDKLAGGTPSSSSELPQTNPETVQASPQLKSPEVDIETLRGAMLEDARRTAQAEIPKLVQMQVNVETASLKSDISRKDATIASLSQELKEKTSSEVSLKKQLNDAALLRKSLEEQLQKVQKEAELATQTYEAQLINLQTTKPPEWYHEQTQKWLSERETLQGKINVQDQTIRTLSTQLQELTTEKSNLEKQLEEKTRENEALQLALPRDLVEVVDNTLEDDFIVVPDNEMSLKTIPTGDGRVVAFMGTKHGVGNTTVALNTAVALANCGYKTLFIELNRQFPLVNEFFEFSNIIRGLDTAIKAVQQNNLKVASQCIIKPHGIITSKKGIGKVYKRLPGPLHFLLYSNDFLLRCKDGTAPYIEERELKDLIYFLTMQERYSYVIVDLQPDEQKTIQTFLGSSYHVNQLVLTLTQDPHSITTAGYMITALARSRNVSLIQGAEFIVNQFSVTNKMTVGKISNFLHVPESRISKVSLDSKGYMDASFSAVPYTLSKGKYANEYIDLRMKLTMN